MDWTELENAVSRRLEQSDSLLSSLRRLYLRGAKSGEEVRTALYEDALQALRDITEPFSLFLQIDRNTCSAFLSDAERRRKGLPLTDSGEAGWLCLIPPSRSEARNLLPAPAAAKEQFLRAAGGCGIPDEYFLPLPDGLPDPRARCVHTYGNSREYFIRLENVDSGGLFSAENPEGRRFVLTGEYGLKADIRVDRVFSEGETVPFRNHLTAKRAGTMAVTGSLEGYTASRERPFEIRRDGTRGLWVFLPMDAEDVRTFLSFPLWAGYHQHLAEKTDLLASRRFRAFESSLRKAE